MKANFILLSVFPVAFLLFFPVTLVGANAGTIVQVLDTGQIVWCKGIVQARGVAAPDNTHGDGDKDSDSPLETLAAARRIAEANLLETVGAVRIDSRTWVKDRMVQDKAFRSGVNALVRNASLTHQEYLSDGTVEVELEMSLTGGFAQFVLPEEIRQVDSVTTVTNAKPEDNEQSTQAQKVENEPYTGLILDATGIDAQPALVPVVVDELGDVVYGPAFVSREFSVSRGMCAFSATLEAARNKRRVGPRPLVIKVLRTALTGATDLVISTADAARLRSSVDHLNFLKACRVSIVMVPKVVP